MFYIQLNRILFVKLNISQFSPPKRDWMAERAEYLANLQEHANTTDEDRRNIDSVLRDYRGGSLKRLAPGKGVIYFASVRRTDDIVIPDFDWSQALEWAKEPEGRKGGFISRKYDAQIPPFHFNSSSRPFG